MIPHARALCVLTVIVAGCRPDKGGDSGGAAALSVTVTVTV